METHHIIMETIFIMISLRMLKKSAMTFALSPILPMHIPKVMKKPIRPGRECDHVISPPLPEGTVAIRALAFPKDPKP